MSRKKETGQPPKEINPVSGFDDEKYGKMRGLSEEERKVLKSFSDPSVTEKRRERVYQVFQKGMKPIIEYVERKQREESENVFHKEGESWQIRFKKKKSFRLRDSRGLNYIHYLLEHPNKPIPAVDLAQMGRLDAEIA